MAISFSIAMLIASAQAAQTPVIIGFTGTVDEQTVAAVGGKVTQIFPLINALAATIPTTSIETLKANRDVAYVDVDEQAHLLDHQTVPWGITKVDAPSVWTGTASKGTGVKVAIIDSGIDVAHPDLNVVGGASFVAGTTSYNDDNGHGTHVAGIIAALDNDIGVVGVAPEASLYAVKVMNSKGSGSISAIISGIQWSINNGMQVISISLGSSADSSALRSAVEKAYNAGIVVVAAAGNAGPGANTIGYPGGYPFVISVAAVDGKDTVASFSSRGPQIDVSAPGVSINSTYKGQTYRALSGTSMATPYVSGTVALMLQNSQYTPDEIKEMLESTAIDLGPEGKDSSYGAGRIDAYAAMTIAAPPIEPPISVPMAPQNVAATAGNTQVMLSWSRPPTGSPVATNYTIYRGTSMDTLTAIATIGRAISYKDTNLTNGQTYYYSISAINMLGESVLSEIVLATPNTPTLAANVATNAGIYLRGSAGTAVISVADSQTANPIQGATVTVNYIYPNGTATTPFTRVTDITGKTVVDFSIGNTAPIGDYIINANVAAPGYDIKIVQTTFTLS